MSFQEAELGEVCLVKRGTTITQKDAVAGDIPVVAGGLQPTYFHNQANRFNKTITISGSGANAGYVNLWKQPIFASDCSTVEVEDNKLDINYVYYFLLSKQEFIYKELRSGAAQPHVYGKDISKLLIKILPLAKQEEVVSKLDMIIAEIEKTITATEANIKNAEALFQSYLKDVFERGGKGWERVKLGSISKVLNGYSFESSDFNFSNGVKCIKITNVGIREFVNATNEYLPDTFAKKYSNFLVKQGSIVIPLTRTIIGGGLKIAIVPREFDNSLLNQRVASVEAIPEIIDNDLLYFYLSSSIFSSYVLSNINPLMQPNLSIKDLLSFQIPVPPKNIQLNLKNKISSFINSINKIKKGSLQKLSLLNSLKQSILNKTFNDDLEEEYQ